MHWASTVHTGNLLNDSNFSHGGIMPRQGATTRGYRMANQGQPTQRQGLKGMYILQDNSGCQVYKPTWGGTRTIFRPFPARNPENPQEWDLCRLSDEEGDWGDWVRRYDIAFSFGTNGYTFILKDPMQDSIDDQQNPAWMLYRAIDQAVKSGQGQPSWNPLIFGGAGRPAALSAPKDGYVMQGILMEHRSNPKDPPLGCTMDHSPIVMLMSQSAGAAMLERLGEKNSDGSWVYPDATSLDGGLFLQFHQAGTQRAAGAAPQTMGAASVGRGGVERNRYEVLVLDNYNGIAPQAIDPRVVEAHVRNWDDIIRVPTIEEQVRLICNCGIPADAITYALGDVYGQFIPQAIWEQARGQQTHTSAPAAEMPAPGMMGGEPTHPMQPTGVMGASAPTQTAPPAGMPAETAPLAPVADTPAAPAASETPPATPEASLPAEQGFDPQPTHAEPGRAQSTMDALERARERARQTSGG